MLYIDASSGISGDMTVAMLLDLGANEDKLKKVIGSLPIDGAKIVISRVQKSGIDAVDFDVVLDERHENHDHDMEYLYGHQSHDHENYHHDHRSLSDVYAIIDAGTMSERARALAKKIFLILGEAEAKAHGTTLTEVHFHEVGAVDSIIDIVSAAVCLDDLNITEALIPSLSEGSGQIRCAHGLLPVPVPAVLNIIEKYAIPLRHLEYEGEFVTPTGAAISAAIRIDNPLPETYRITKSGYGAGKRTHELSGLLRGMIIETTE